MSSILTTYGLDRLTVAQRLQLLEELWDSLESDVDQLPLTDAQRRKLDRRVAALDANPDAAIPWEEVEARARALARLKR